MNRINPLYILLLIFVLFIFFTFKLNYANDELSEIQQNYKESSKLAIKIDNIKKAYKDKNRVIKKINNILKNSVLQNIDIKRKITNSKIILLSNSINKSALNYLIGKFLNNSFDITKLNIKKIDNKKATLEVEIRW